MAFDIYKLAENNTLFRLKEHALLLKNEKNGDNIDNVNFSHGRITY